jgi:hypothetical protein
VIYRSCAVDLDEMDAGKCREGGRDGVDWPPGRPARDCIQKWASGQGWSVLVARWMSYAASTGPDVMIWSMRHGQKPCGGVRGAAPGRKDGQG